MNRNKIPNLVGSLVANQKLFKPLSKEVADRMINPETSEAEISRWIGLMNPILIHRPKESFEIETLDDDLVISQASDLFLSFYCVGFKQSELDVVDLVANKTGVESHELVRDANNFQILAHFASTRGFSDLFFSPRQFIEICREKKTKAKAGESFLIPICANGKYFVAYVHVPSDGLRVYVFHLGHVDPWHGSFRHRVVVPQLVS